MLTRVQRTAKRYIRVHLSSCAGYPAVCLQYIIVQLQFSIMYALSLYILFYSALWNESTRKAESSRQNCAGKNVIYDPTIARQATSQMKTGERGERECLRVKYIVKEQLSQAPGKTYDLIRRRTAPSSGLLEIPHFCEPALVGLCRPVIFRVYL